MVIKLFIEKRIMNINEHFNIIRKLSTEKELPIDTILESLNYDLILEKITREDLHAKYYSNIPPEDFNKILDADPTKKKDGSAGKYTKWLLSIYMKKMLKLEDLYKATEYLTLFAKNFNHLERKNIADFKNLPDLYREIEKFDTDELDDEYKTNKEKAREAKEGGNKVYEDEDWLVVVPETKEAACYYGAGTQWCTAAREDNMFDHYSETGSLYININKKTKRKYQFHLEDGQFMDEKDSEIEVPISETIEATQGLIDFYANMDLDLEDDWTMGDYYLNKNNNDEITITRNGEMIYSLPFKPSKYFEHTIRNTDREDFDYFSLMDVYGNTYLLCLDNEDNSTLFETRDYYENLRFIFDKWTVNGNELMNEYSHESLENIEHINKEDDYDHNISVFGYNNEGYFYIDQDSELQHENFPKNMKSDDFYDIRYEEGNVELMLDEQIIEIPINDPDSIRVIER